MNTRKKIISLVIITLLCLSFSGCTKVMPKGDITIIDALGRNVLVPQGAEKFVCIGPGCLRLYTYVGDINKLVGVEDIEKDVIGRSYIMAYPELADFNKIGPGGPNNAPDAEKLLIRDPDVIFTTYNSDAASVDQLQQKTGIPVVALSYGEIAVFDTMVDKSIEIIGQVTGEKDRAKEIIDYFAEIKLDLENRVKDLKNEDKPSVYLGAQSMRGAHGIESTSGNFSLFNAIGARNVVDEAGIKQYVMLDKEALLEMDPEIIFIDAAGLSLVQEDYKTNSSFYKGLQAFKNDKVFLQLPYNYYSTNIDIALADTYYIGKVLYPEHFSDIDPIKKFNEITKKLLRKDLYDSIATDYFGGFQKLSFIP